MVYDEQEKEEIERDTLNRVKSSWLPNGYWKGTDSEIDAYREAMTWCSNNNISPPLTKSEYEEIRGS